MEGQNSNVPVRAGAVRVPLKRGDNADACAVFVRTLRRTDLTDLMRASHVTGNDNATFTYYAELTQRLHIVDADGLTDGNAPDFPAVKFTTEKVPGLTRPVASRDVLNALTDEDLAAINKACPPMPGGLGDGQKGN